ncbi:MAG: dockerin type I repeat-containing protein [Clostridia bacterium]|nr:dockerin type I repeat-containing protein [Clostridia bacterium]
MKSIKKLLSVLTAISIIAVMFAVAVVPVYADPGDVFTVNAVPEGWRYYTSSYITRENSGAQFGVAANKGKGLDNYGVLLANALSTEVVKPATTYRISFNIYTWYNISALQADVDTGTALWSRTNKITTFSNLANNVTASSGGGDTRYSYDVSLDVTTPSTITGNQHFVLGVITKDGSTTTAANLRFRNITVTEAKEYSVIDSATGESIGTIGAFPGADTAKLIEGSAYDKEGYVFETSPATLADDTVAITVTYYAKRELEVYDADSNKLLGTVFAVEGDDAYTVIGNSPYNLDGFNFEVEPEFVEDDTEALYVTYTESPVQMIYFDKDYRGNSASTSFASWQQLATDANGTLEIVEDKLRPRVWETGGVKMTAKTQFSNRAFVLANNYGKSGIVPGKTYRVIMRITMDTQYWNINELNAEIKFGSNVWNDLTDYATLSGEDLAALVIETEERETVVDYILSMDIAVPESAKSNIVMSLYGFVTSTDPESGEETTSGVYYTVDDIQIWNTFDVAVQDQNGEALGTVKARVGDKVERAAKAYLGEHDGYVYTATADTVESLEAPIVLNKALPGENEHIPGDVNKDGALNNKDLTRLFQYLSDWDVEVDENALDINGDGSVNNKDLTRLFQYLSDWDVEIF